MGFASSALIALLAVSAPDPAAESAESAYVSGLHSQIRERGSPRERALFARMGTKESAGMDDVLRAAAQEAPTDSLVQMFWSTQGKDALDWSRLEPGNGFAWLPALEADGDVLDDAALDAAIARIAESPGYDDHFVDAWLAYRQAIGARPIPPGMMKFAHGDAGLARDTMAMAYASALPLPLLVLTHACQRSRHPQASAARFANCARIGRDIAQSNVSLFSKHLGTSLVRASGSEEESDREVRRALDWLQHASVGLLDDRNGAKPGEVAAYFADLASTASETRALELLLARHGISIRPPAHWRVGQ